MNFVPVLELHMDVRWIIHFLGTSFNILPVIGSYPGTFRGLRSSCIILIVKNVIGCIIYSGSSSDLLISVPKGSFCDSY
jgi:hypothetical protein